MIELYHGDCLIEMAKIPDGSVDMVMADPPYGTTACKWDSIIPLEPMWEHLKRVTKKNGAIVMTASQPFTTTLIASNMKMFKYCLVWDKFTSFPGLAKIRPMPSHEDIVVFGEGKVTYNPQMEEGKPYTDKRTYRRTCQNEHKFGWETLIPQINNGTRYPKSVIRITKANFKGQHPTQKPVALMEYLIKTYTNEGETVLDFTMGSGTTGVACVNLNRNFIGIEMDDGYFQIAKDRIEQAKNLFSEAV